MTRVCLSTLCAAALCLLAASTSMDSDAAGPRPAPVVDRGCKPTAAIEVSLTSAGASGSRVDLDVVIRPQRTFLSLEWELVLPEDGVLLEGALAGEALAERDADTVGRVALSLPEDGRFRRASLFVHGVFEGSDETGETFDEPVTVVKHLVWGEPPAPAPIVLSRDAETGEMTPFVALPTAHREGR